MCRASVMVKIMSRSVALALLAAALLAGCSHGSGKALGDASSSTPAKEAPADPMETTRAGMHEGAFQLSNAADDIESALAKAKALQTATKNVALKAALTDVLDLLDDAGSSIADYTGEPPELADFKAQFPEQDQKRLDSIDHANDALHDVNDVYDLLDDFAKVPSASDASALAELGNALDDASGDLEDAIIAFGGKVEADTTEDVPTPAAPKTAGKAAPEL